MVCPAAGRGLDAPSDAAGMTSSPNHSPTTVRYGLSNPNSTSSTTTTIAHTRAGCAVSTDRQRTGSPAIASVSARDTSQSPIANTAPDASAAATNPGEAAGIGSPTTSST